MKIWHNTTLNTLYNTIEYVKCEMVAGEFIFLATHEDPFSPIQDVADDFAPEFCEKRSDYLPEGYLEWAIKLCKTRNVDVFIPYIYREGLSKYRDEFAQVGVRLLTAGNFETMRILENKPRFLDEINRSGLRGTTYLPYSSLKEFDDAWGVLYDGKTPLCIKPCEGIYGTGFHVIHAECDDLHNMMTGARHHMSLQRFRAMLSDHPGVEPSMLMPFLQGLERSVDFACLDGELLASYTRTKKGRHQIIDHDDRHHGMAQEIAAQFKLSGVLNMQTIEDREGVPHILEVNSRSAGGMFKGIHSGVNLQLILLRALAGDTRQPAGTARRVVVADINQSLRME